MGTKTNPGKFDCYAAAEPNEPMFILLGRDRHAAAVVRYWVSLRIADAPTVTATAKLLEALDCAAAMERWHKDHPHG